MHATLRSSFGEEIYLHAKLNCDDSLGSEMSRAASTKLLQHVIHALLILQRCFHIHGKHEFSFWQNCIPAILGRQWKQNLEKLCRVDFNFRIFVAQSRTKILGQVGQGQTILLDLRQALSDCRRDAGLWVLVLLQDEGHETLHLTLQIIQVTSVDSDLSEALCRLAHKVEGYYG